MGDLDLKQYEKLGPFEIKDFLAKVATKSAQDGVHDYLNAGRGNPNWGRHGAARGLFPAWAFRGDGVASGVLDLPPGVGGMPKAAGVASRLEAWLCQAPRYARRALPAANGAVRR